MKKLIFLTLISIFFSPIFSQEINSEDWKTDLNFIRTELPKKHIDLFNKISQEEFNNHIDHIITDLDKDNDVETSIKIMTLIAKIGDSHTNVSSKILKSKSSLPIGLSWFKEGLVVTVTSDEDYEILEKKLISINGFPMERIIDSVKTIYVSENEGMIKKYSDNLIKHTALLNYFGFSNSDETTYKLELEDSNGNRFNHTLNVNNTFEIDKRKKLHVKFNNERPFYMDGSMKNFKEKYFPDDSIYYVQYNKCVSSETVERYGDEDSAYQYPSFVEFENIVIKNLNNENIEKLIFDMRFNGGGSSFLAENLIKEISKSRFNKKGKLFVVVGTDTFSSAIFNTVDFIENTEAIIVGEPTSGKPNHYGNIDSFTLPYSETKISFSKNYYHLSDKDDISIVPDFIIERSFTDFKNGIDPVYEFIKNYR